jgi:hypothetical protein
MEGYNSYGNFGRRMEELEGKSINLIPTRSGVL